MVLVTVKLKVSKLKQIIGQSDINCMWKRLFTKMATFQNHAYGVDRCSVELNFRVIESD